MEIIMAKPQGYCMGVAKALKITIDALSDPSIPKPIYSLGMVIHNKRINNALKTKGLIILHGNKEEEIQKIAHGSVLFSAHGVKPVLYDLAIKKGLRIIDTTCRDVLHVHDSVKKALSEQKKVYYLGNSGHAECEGVLGISDNITLLTGDIVIDNNSFFACQTTLSIDDITEASKKYNIPVSDFGFRCKATTNRQKALDQNVDLTIVVGDKLSNNSQKLFSIANSNNKTILIEDLSDLQKSDLINVSRVLITAGASTPPQLVNEVITYLSSDMKEEPRSKLTDSDLLD